MPLSPDAFLAELDKQNRRALDRIRTASAAGAPDDTLTVARLLTLALKNELEATECAASWIPTTPEVDVKLALARQAGDEAKHYRLIQKRLAELGVDTTALDPFASGKSALLAFLLDLRDTAARVAAGQVTREALALVRNEEFARFCRARGDAATADLYDTIIQPDERHHHELGRTLLRALAVTDEAQQSARNASARTLELAEELQEVARLRMGIAHAPGC